MKKLFQRPLAALLLLILGATLALAREAAVHVDPVLSAEGLRAAQASLPPEAENSREVAVFIAYDRGFYGKLYLSGFGKDNTEIARSAFLQVNQPAQAGGHASFAFDKDAQLGEVLSFTLNGIQETPPPRPKKESFGEAAKNIVKELLE